ncbi:MAG: hypothetical protein ACFFEK_09610 [Candidatus Thorarchaeota archaeon]
MKETKEILANILQMKKSDYELTKAISVSSQELQDEEETEKPNVLSGDAEDTSKEEQEVMEDYESTQVMDFEVDEVKDCLEKKKKRRNYLEFRPDYEKD